MVKIVEGSVVETRLARAGINVVNRLQEGGDEWQRLHIFPPARAINSSINLVYRLDIIGAKYRVITYLYCYQPIIR